MYQCALKVGATHLRRVHNVEVYISPELESRNWSRGVNYAETIYRSALLGIIVILHFLLHNRDGLTTLSLT